MEQSIELRRQKLERNVKVGAALVAGLAFSPIIVHAIGGLIGVVVALVLGQAAVQLAPVYSMKLANWRLRLIAAEASANPIETLQQLYIDKYKELEEADHNIIEFETEIGNFDDDIKGFARDYPDEAPRYAEISSRMHQGLLEMQQEHEQAKDDLNQAAMALKKAKAIYKMSLAAAKVTQLSKTAEETVFADIKQQVAFDSIRSNLNRSFAQLNSALAKRERPQLPAKGGAA